MLRLILIIVCALSSLATYAKQFSPIEQLTTVNGLSQNSVTAMLEDSRGYIWIATYDGLNRYDGSRIRTYANDIESSYLPSNRILSLCEDSRGNIWVGTDLGIAMYDYNQSKWHKINNTTINNNIIGLKFNKQSKQIIVFRNNGEISIYDENRKQISTYVIPAQKSSRAAVKFISVFSLNEGEYIILTNVGMYSYSIEKEAKYIPIQLKSSTVISIAKIDDSTMWLLCSDGSVMQTRYRINKKGIVITNLKVVDSIKPHIGYRTLYKDSNGSIWIASNNYSHYIEDPYNIKLAKIVHPGQSIGVIESSMGYVWIYTANSGVTRFMVDGDFFKTLNLNIDKNDFSYRNIKEFDSDNIIINTTNGFYKYNTINKSYSTYENTPLPSNITPRQQIQYNDTKGNQWIVVCCKLNNTNSTEWYNVWCLVENNKAAIKCIIPEFKLPTKIDEDQFGRMWVSCGDNLYYLTYNGKVLSYSNITEHDETLQYLKFSRIMKLYCDPNGKNLWVGTQNKGLFRFNIARKDKINIVQYECDANDPSTLSSNFVSDIYRTSAGVLWIATEQGGVCRAIEKSSGDVSFRRYTKRDGLSNNVTKSILEDNNGCIWISSNIGLSMHDIASNRFHSYRIKDGLPFETFGYSSYKDQSGLLYFVSQEGVCYFDPSNKIEHKNFELQFEELKISGFTILPNQKSREGNVILHKRLGDGDSLTLNYNQNFFSVGVSSLHYGNDNSHHIRYRLLPTNKEWSIQDTNSESITFNGLQQGIYTLEVSSSSFDNKWSVPKSLYIEVKPPFWRSALAYAIYILVISTIAAIIIYFIIRNFRLDNDLKIKNIEKSNLEKMNNDRKELFANIAHELKTPLTLINAPVDYLYSELSMAQDDKDKLRLIQRQIRKMNQLIDFTICYQSDSTEIYQPNHTIFDIGLFMKDVVDEFSFLARHSQKTLSADVSLDQTYVYADYSMIEKIIYNIINNAFKYTNAKDLISITCSVEDDRDLVVVVADSGVGIPKESIPHIFERHYHSQNPTRFASTGIGLHFSRHLAELHSGTINATSDEGEGSTFVLRLPIVTNERPTEADLNAEDEGDTAEQNFKVIIDDCDVVSDNALGVGGDMTHSEVRLFIVEDDPEVRFMLTNLLSPLYKIKCFTNGVECLAGLEDEWPDVILSDIMMPEMDGWTLCQRVKDDIKTSHIPIILLTAVASNVENRMKGLKYGADAYISKPFYSKHLLSCINSLLQSREMLKKRFQTNLPTSFTAEEQHDRRLDYDFIQKLYGLIDQHIMEDMPYETYARELGVSRSLFYNKIKAITDMTPAELLRDYRLTKAAELLAQSKYSITDVYLMTGFKSRSTFSKLFKAKYEVSPKDYNK